MPFVYYNNIYLQLCLQKTNILFTSVYIYAKIAENKVTDIYFRTFSAFGDVLFNKESFLTAFTVISATILAIFGATLFSYTLFFVWL